MTHETTARLDPAQYWEDPKGGMIPVCAIKPEHQEEDALVKNVVAKARELHSLLGTFKTHSMGEVQAFRELIAEKYGAQKGGKKGNMTLRSFDGKLELQIAISESISFGPELEAAKALIDSCIHKWSEGANANLQVLVDDAFQVDKEGQISTGRILGLRRHSIEDNEWLKAMDAISDAVRVTGSKTYLRLYERNPATGQRTPISLDLAAV
ncbi:DUF3164 family protein [Pseudovibrio sp. WM33]|uniref:DUF3164 family protein n=1 Tax=Pseudovibrio sp. WM33 TaxID=1735585 RepID=UPI0007AE4707|nr:DUF3164 family protein [Pseudovibrio sp. WM33]KZL29436.1 hypothetical protein PsWM33_00011 [Pseudovibrio sp. WM33]